VQGKNVPNGPLSDLIGTGGYRGFSLSALLTFGAVECTLQSVVFIPKPELEAETDPEPATRGVTPSSLVRSRTCKHVARRSYR
jgi:hypothetical protein